MKPLRQIAEEKLLRDQYNPLVGKTVGSIPVDEFLQELLPAENLPDPGQVNFCKVAQAKSSEAACRALMQAGGQLCPNFEFVHASARLNANVSEGLRPSTACYRKPTSRIRDPADDWLAMEMFVTIGEKDEADPWTMDPNSEEAYKDPSWKSRAGIIKYAQSQFAYQMRVFTFSLSFYNRSARFFLWDRSGALVTEAFDYVAQPRLLASFLQRFNSLSREKRGWDTTACPATYTEGKLLADAIHTYLDEVRAYRVPMLNGIHKTLDRRYPTYKLLLDHSHRNHSCEVIIRRPFVIQTLHLVGRSTQGYIGYHLGEKRLVFMKDYWSEDGKRSIRLKRLIETDVWHSLTSNSVPHIPNIVYAGRVMASEGADQHTPSAVYSLRGLSDDKGYHGPRLRVHMRVVQDIAYPLQYVCSSRQLVLAVRNALTVIQQAADKAQVLHCDITARNIMLSADGCGILNDWDTARSTDSPDESPAGTWFYASIRTYPGAKRQHTILDDVEACFWVLLHQSIKFFEYDELSCPLDFYAILSDKSGSLKSTFLFDEKLEAPQFHCAPLSKLLADLRQMVKRIYDSLESTEPQDSSQAIALIDQALSLSGWPEADARHDWPNKEAPPENVEEFVSSLSMKAVKSLYKPDHFQLAVANDRPGDITSVGEVTSDPVKTLPAAPVTATSVHNESTPRNRKRAAREEDADEEQLVSKKDRTRRRTLQSDLPYT